MSCPCRTLGRSRQEPLVCSQSVYVSAPEWLALIAAIGISIWCMAKPLGGPNYELRESTHLLGAFVSRTSWGLVLFGSLLTLGGVAGSMAAIYDVSTGRKSQRRVLPAVAGQPGFRRRVCVVGQQQLHRTPKVTDARSGRLDSCSW
jgi:hypothetical protein